MTTHRATPLIGLALLALLLGTMLFAFSGPVSAAAETQLDRITPSFPDGLPDKPVITSKAAILIDADTGQILFSKSANTRLPMASTTKMMTGILAIESLALNQDVTISPNVPATYGSMLGFRQGEILPVSELLYALLVPSANDAAVALAEAVAGGVPAFVKLMNEKARDLGLSNTHFVNPSGLNAKGHYSSAKDLATLAAYAMRDPVFRNIVNTEKYTFWRPGEGGKTVERKSENHNLLLGKYGWITGVKTGQTPYAKYCLVASATKDGVNLIAVVLGAKDEITRQKEAKALLLYGYALYPQTTLADHSKAVMSLEAADPLGRHITLVPECALTARIYKTDAVTVSTNLTRNATLPVQAGDVFGEAQFTLRGKMLGSVALVAAETVEPASLKMILTQWRGWWPPRLALGDFLETAPES